MVHNLDTIVGRAKRRGFVYPGSDIYGGLANARDYGPYGIQLKKNIQDLRRTTFVQKRQDMVGLDSQILMHPKVWETSGHVDNFDDPLIDDKNTGERFRADKIIEDLIDKHRALVPQILTHIYQTILDHYQEILTKQKNSFDNIDQEIGAIEYYGKNSPLLEDLINGIDTSISYERNILSKITKNLELLKTIKHAIDLLNKGDVDQGLILLYKHIFGYNLPNLIPESRSFDLMKTFIVAEIPNNPNTKKPAERTDVRKFQMMFYTYQGVTHTEDDKIRMRPETAQGIFVNFRNVVDTMRVRVPFGIAQVGKSFRNEITPGNFLYRTREFEQMEIEYFVPANLEEGMKHFEDRKQTSMHWRKDIVGFQEENLRFREHEQDELSHYSAGTFDVEYRYPRGRGELQGIAYRTDFDLSRHQEASNTKMIYNDPQTGERYVPHCIEPSFGLSRTVLASMFDAYDEEVYTDGNGKEQTRVVAHFDRKIAPVKFAIFPLIKKDPDQVRIAEQIFADLSTNFVCEYDDGGAIGKRYRRHDEIGTPFCVTIDHDSVEDGTVTIRDRDTMEQKRVKIEELAEFMK